MQLDSKNGSNTFYGLNFCWSGAAFFSMGNDIIHIIFANDVNDAPALEKNSNAEIAGGEHVVLILKFSVFSIFPYEILMLWDCHRFECIFNNKLVRVWADPQKGMIG